MTQFTTEDFRTLGVCREGLARVEQFGGVITNSAEGWAAYIAAYPDAWRAPVWVAQRLGVAGDLSWRIAKIAFREQPERNAHLRVYAETLGPDNWREAEAAADAAADAADAAYAAAYAAAAYAADAADAADAAYADAAYAYAAADAYARKRVRAEIVVMAAEVLTR